MDKVKNKILEAQQKLSQRLEKCSATSFRPPVQGPQKFSPDRPGPIHEPLGKHDLYQPDGYGGFRFFNPLKRRKDVFTWNPDLWAEVEAAFSEQEDEKPWAEMYFRVTHIPRDLESIDSINMSLRLTGRIILRGEIKNTRGEITKTCVEVTKIYKDSEHIQVKFTNEQVQKIKEKCTFDFIIPDLMKSTLGFWTEIYNETKECEFENRIKQSDSVQLERTARYYERSQQQNRWNENSLQHFSKFLKSVPVRKSSSLGSISATNSYSEPSDMSLSLGNGIPSVPDIDLGTATTEQDTMIEDDWACPKGLTPNSSHDSDLNDGIFGTDIQIVD